MGLWAANCESQHYCICLALYDSQFSSGVIESTTKYMYIVFLVSQHKFFSIFQGLFIFIFHVLRNDKVSIQAVSVHANMIFMMLIIS